MEKTALVTGAEGFIGSHLARFLQEKGWNVVAGYRMPGSNSFPQTSGLTYLQCELCDREQLKSVVEKYQPTHVFHLAAQSLPTLSWERPIETFESNIMGSLYLFESLRSLKRKPVVVSACSSAEYGPVPESAIPVREEQPLRPLHPYGISKVCLDLLSRQYFLDYKIPIVRIRLFNTTGPGKTNDAPSDFVRQLVGIRKGLQQNVMEVGNLKPRRAFLDVHDAVRGFYLAALKGKRGEAYNLCAPKTYRMQELVRTAIRLSGVKPEVRPVSRLMRPSDEKIIFGRTDKIRRDTGWKPVRTVEQTLGSMFEYWDRVL